MRSKPATKPSAPRYARPPATCRLLPRRAARQRRRSGGRALRAVARAARPARPGALLRCEHGCGVDEEGLHTSQATCTGTRKGWLPSASTASEAAVGRRRLADRDDHLPGTGGERCKISSPVPRGLSCSPGRFASLRPRGSSLEARAADHRDASPAASRPQGPPVSAGDDRRCGSPRRVRRACPRRRWRAAVRQPVRHRRRSRARPRRR